jgi:tRNA pseudouridine38-40 synthase
MSDRSRYFFHIGYNGSRYNGWQKLPQINSVQLIMETFISQIGKEPVTINGCGRTDSHVHATQYFFHVDLDERVIPEMKFRLNKNLPNDIAVFDIIPMTGTPHARLDATQRNYNYFIHRAKDPFLENVSALYQEKHLDLHKMKSATMLLMNYSDYKAFYRKASKPRTTISKVTNAGLYVDKTGDRLKFTISANRFLRGMIRMIVQRLLDVGRGKLSLEQFESYLNGFESTEEVRSAHPQGLYLSKVTYPFLDIPPQAIFVDMINNENTWRDI